MQRNFKNQNYLHLVGFVCNFRTKNIWKRCKAWIIGNSGVLLRQQERGGVHHFAPSTKLAIGYADQPTKAQVMFCIHNYLSLKKYVFQLTALSEHGELGLPALSHAVEAAKIGQGFISLKFYVTAAHNIFDQGENSKCIKQWYKVCCRQDYSSH